ncbi:chemotaxis response regulator protein-glutamate methylesterase [Acrasis kona]|uniref:Chemotaxis response regulator protein-glutamate methylesterase n=1 Tax=Acrasis kona TaxID=1008807 RepID=A0AAW2Z6K4_9EUKA
MADKCKIINEVMIESVFTDEALFDAFYSFLQQTSTPNGLLFLKATREIFISFSHQLVTCILKDFITEGSESEILIKERDRSNLINNIRGNNSEKFMPILKDLYNSIYLELSTDAYCLFLNSKQHASFAKSRGAEYIESLTIAAPAITSTLNTFNEEYIKSQDIEFMIQMTESSNQWKLCEKAPSPSSKRKEYYVYQSCNKICVEGEYKCPLARCNGYLNCSADVAIHALVDEQYNSRIFIPNKTPTIKKIAYDRTIREFSQIVGYVELKLPFLTTRHSIGMGTLAFDHNRKCYVWTIKSTSGLVDELNLHRVAPNTIGTISMHTFLVFPVSDKRCRFIALCYADINLNKTLQKLASSKFEHRKWGKHVFERWTQFIKERGRKGPSEGCYNDTLEDNLTRHGNKLSFPSNLPLQQNN